MVVINYSAIWIWIMKQLCVFFQVRFCSGVWMDYLLNTIMEIMYAEEKNFELLCC